MVNFNAFQMIQDPLAEELAKQGFQPPEPLEDEERGQAVMFRTDEVAYSLLYDRKAQRFELRSTTFAESGKHRDWRTLSMWLFDEKTGERSDVESILNDFLEVIRGPKRVAAVQQRRKRGKDDERVVDPLFFMNRLVGIFPELRGPLNEEKIMYGQVRAATFTKTHVAALCDSLASQYPDSEPCKKLCALLDDMYDNGGIDLRSIISYTLMNNVGDEAFEAIRSRVGDELAKDLKYTRKLKGKKIKPEKKKRQKKIESRLKV